MLFALDDELTRWLPAFIGALVIAGLAWRIRSLSTDGMAAAIVLGTVVVGAAGWWAGAILIAFFISSSILSRTGHDHITVSTARGSRRDATQVMANGGIALLTSIGWAITGHDAWLLALSGSLAAANADTWSTEIGRASGSIPRLITTGQRVAAGTSGAVSVRGLVGALGGSLLIGALTAIGAHASWIYISHTPLTALLAVTIAGTVGSLVDSFTGATFQEQRWCPSCNKQTEEGIHHCGTPTCHVRGFPWMTNDIVNVLCVTSGAVSGAALAAALAL